MATKALEDTYKARIEPNLGFIGNMLRWGAPMAKIAERLGVSEAVLTRMAETNSELATVVEQALMQRDEDIQRAFFEAALGGYHTDIRQSVKTLPDGTKMYEEVQTKRWKGADARILSLLLMNTDRWFTDKTDMSRRLEEEAMDLRRRLIEGQSWTPAEGSAVRERRTGRLSPPLRRKG